MKIRSIVVTAVAVAGLLAGCASVIDGNGSGGSGGPTGSSSSPDFPTPSAPGATSGVATPTPSSSSSPLPSTSSSGTGAPAGTDFDCPSVAYPFAHLSFECITTGLTSSTTDEVWPLTEHKSVESTGWAVEMGAGHWGPKGSATLASITQTVRKRMLDGGSYLPSPKVTTNSAKDATVAGVKAHILQSSITLNKAAAAKRGTKVKVEKLWIIAMEVGTDDVSLWYASIPDLVSSLWARVPSFIDTIHVT